MIELLGGTKAEEPQTGDVLFLYDPATNKDLISDTVVGAIKTATEVDPAVLIDGQSTLKTSSVNSGVLITLPTALDLETMQNWTLEWSSIWNAYQSGYATELFMDITNTAGFPIGCRWTDGGYQERNQFNASDWNNARIWRPSSTKTQVIGQLNRWALVRKGSYFFVMLNGVRQLLENGTVNGTKQSLFNKTQALPTVTKMYLGYFNATNRCYPGNFGRIRFSNFARYVGDYTPQPF
jgi:hypothetical protein